MKIKLKVSYNYMIFYLVQKDSQQNYISEFLNNDSSTEFLSFLMDGFLSRALQKDFSTGFLIKVSQMVSQQSFSTGLVNIDFSSGFLDRVSQQGFSTFFLMCF